ncbi:MAG: FCSD flavin-binding domain-containing protein [Granulosicoccus sp.]
MSHISRRKFNTMLTLGSASLLSPVALLGQSKPKVVIIGGGAGGATMARYLANDSSGQLDITLIEDSPRYTTCFFSNLYLGDIYDFESITFNYDTLASRYGVNVVNGYAESITPQSKQVKLRDGTTLQYDRLVVAPGIEIDYDDVPGYSKDASELAPHAWQAGPQTTLLKQKLDSLEDGQNIIIVAPPNPYRCPPGPYERASMMAHSLYSKGFENSNIYIIDRKETFAKQNLFTEGWETHYPGIIEWYSSDIHGGIVQVDTEAGIVETDLDTFEGSLLNVIPAQKAGSIAASAGLTDDSGFCPIEAASMRSTLDENIYVIGDASVAGDMPKSGFAANSQAKVAAMVIRAELLSSSRYPATYANVCWSLISLANSVKVGAHYAPGDDGQIRSTSSFISESKEASATRTATYQEAVGWYSSITKDMFG